MIDKFKFIILILIILLAPVAAISVFYVVHIQTLAAGNSQVISTSGALQFDGKTFYKAADVQNKLRIAGNFSIETRIRPETSVISPQLQSTILARTSNTTLLDFYHLYLKQATPSGLTRLIDKPNFKVFFFVRANATEDSHLSPSILLESKNTIPVNEWSIIKITRLQKQLTLTVNGVSTSAYVPDIYDFVNDGTDYIGAYYQLNELPSKNPGNSFYKGAIDYLKIRNGETNLTDWEFNCSLKNISDASYDAQLFRGTIKFFDFASGGISSFVGGHCDKPVVLTPTPGITFIPVTSPTPTPGPNHKPYFDEPVWIKNRDPGIIREESKKSGANYYVTFVAKDLDGDNLDLNIRLSDLNNLNVKNYLSILPGRPDKCVVSNISPPTVQAGEKVMTLCGTIPPTNKKNASIVVQYEANDGKVEGKTSGFYYIRIVN